MAAPIVRRVLLDHNVFCRRYSVGTAPPGLGGTHSYRMQQLKGEEDLPSFKERMKELKEKKEDQEKSEPIDIGIPYNPPKYGWKTRLEQWKLNRDNKELEQKARLRKLQLPIHEVREAWHKEMGPIHTQVLAEHYGIFNDLFGGAYFTPSLEMQVSYDFDEEYITPVFRGNKIPPADASTAPHISYESEDNDLWTLLLTNPDGHLTDNDAEYVHWMVANIPGSDISKGETLFEYLQPFPPEGTGYHRHIFVLYKQEKHINYSELKCKDGSSLKDRTFKTWEFMRTHQEQLTPRALNFFQSEWDDSVRAIYHQTLDMREPCFAYAHEPWYIKRQKRYPKTEPFDRYFDRYRDKKEIAEEVLKQKLQMISPFEEYKMPKYPGIYKHRGYVPSWLKTRIALMNRRQEQYKDLPK